MKIEIWSDYVCPFCYIGKRRLENALGNFAHREQVMIEFKSYELDPSTSKKQSSYYEMLAGKYGMSIEQAKSQCNQIAQQASELGLTYNFDTAKPANTFDAHRLAQYAHEQNKGDEMAVRLFEAHFTEGKLLSDHDVLLSLAEEIGLDSGEVSSLLESNRLGKLVRDDETQAQEIGVRGVPFFVFNEKYAVSGAQPEEVFAEVLEKVWEEENEKPVLKTLNTKSSETFYCTDEGCDVKKD